MAMVVVMAALVGTGVWVAVRLEGHMDTPATLARQSGHRHGLARQSGHRHGPPAVHRTGTGHLGAGQAGTGSVGHGHIGTGRNVRCRCRDHAAHQRAGVR
jgi:hypothetical protein